MAKHELVDQPTDAPTEKVVAAGVGAAASQLLIYGIEAVASVDIPGPVEAAITVIVVFAAGYFKRNAAAQA